VYVRPSFEPPIVTTGPATVSNALPLESMPAGSWFLDAGLVDSAGHRVAIPRCPAAVATAQELEKCYQDRGYREFVAYQPPSRFWPFQWLESGIYLALSACLLLLSAWYVRWRPS
jgi:hypothetical protein